MKLPVLLCGFIFYFTSCAQNTYDYRFENAMLECFYQNHTDNNVDVKTIINNVENLLIQHEILLDNSGESYIRVIKKIRDENDLIINPTLLKEIYSIENIPSNVICQDSDFLSRLDTSDLVDSKFNHIIDIFNSIQERSDISTTFIAGEILKVFNASDFENDFYRTIGLVVFSNLIKMNDFESGIARSLPSPHTEKQFEIEEQNIFVVLINKDNKVLANGKIIEVAELKEKAKKFIQETSDKTEIDLPQIGKQMTSKGIISLQNDKATSYEFYILIQNELLKAYNEIRNMYSQRFFNSSYNNLDEEYQSIIRNLVPQRISEAEPKKE